MVNPAFQEDIFNSTLKEVKWNVENKGILLIVKKY